MVGGGGGGVDDGHRETVMLIVCTFSTVSFVPTNIVNLIIMYW